MQLWLSHKGLIMVPLTLWSETTFGTRCTQLPRLMSTQLKYSQDNYYVHSVESHFICVPATTADKQVKQEIVADTPASRFKPEEKEIGRTSRHGKSVCPVQLSTSSSEHPINATCSCSDWQVSLENKLQFWKSSFLHSECMSVTSLSLYKLHFC